MGARLVSSVEVRKGARFDEAILKSITGGDAITAAAKYEAELSFYASFALWLAANDAPTIRDDDEGAWSRVKRVPFVHPLPKDRQDPTMRARLREPSARAAILAWAVRGCLEWQKHGIGTCAAVETSTAEYRADMDRVAGFFAEHCAFEAGARVARAALAHAYEEWCKENGVKAPLSGKEIAARLREKGVTDAKSNGKRMWEGVRLLSAWEEPDRDRGSPEGHPSQKVPTRKVQGTLSGMGDPECPCDPDEERVAIQEEGGE
jgi:putative DNA primase/helicase